MAPTLEEMRLACANADTDSNRFEKPITSSPARSEGSEGFTEAELEAFETELEVTSNSAGDKRTSSPKPKPSVSWSGYPARHFAWRSIMRLRRCTCENVCRGSLVVSPGWARAGLVVAGWFDR